MAARPECVDDRSERAIPIERSIEKADEMIRALSAANRLRAGQRLPRSLQHCDPHWSQVTWWQNAMPRTESGCA